MKNFYIATMAYFIAKVIPPTFKVTSSHRMWISGREKWRHNKQRNKRHWNIVCQKRDLYNSIERERERFKRRELEAVKQGGAQ
jgi:hypothetical protein